MKIMINNKIAAEIKNNNISVSKDFIKIETLKTRAGYLDVLELDKELEENKEFIKELKSIGVKTRERQILDIDF